MVEKVWKHKDSKTDKYYSLEYPLTFSLGQASELVLKAGLAKLKRLDGIHPHDLTFLIERSKTLNIPICENFAFWANLISDNYKDNNYRYKRTFAGFPDSEHDKLSNLQKTKPNDPDTKKEMKKYGLVAISTPDIEKFLNTCLEQIEKTNDWLDNLESNG